jgi:choline kinase
MVDHLAGAILAAGTGERLRHAVSGLPKPLVDVGGRTLLGHQAGAMVELGARPVLTVISSETARLIHERKVELPSELEIVVRDTPNSMETLFAIGEKIREGRFILATVDAVVSRREFERFVAKASELTSPDAPDPLDGALAVVKWRGDRRPLFAETATDGFISGLGARQTSVVTAGIYLFSAAIFRFVEQARNAGLGAMREFLAMLVRNGMRFAAVEITEAIDVDESSDLDAARAMLAASAQNRGAQGER